MIASSELPQDVKDSLLDELREISKRQEGKKYQAKRPTICLSDIECAQTLYSFIRKFISSPKKHQIKGEICLYIWICQHVAFSNIAVGVDEIRTLCITNIDFENLTINFNGQEADITCGLRDLLAAWAGTTERQNKRKLFPILTTDNLEKNLRKFSKDFFGIEGRLQPRDFLGKTHVIPGARIPADLRKQFDVQEALIEGSPYKIDTRKIKKHILEAIHQKRP